MLSPRSLTSGHLLARNILWNLLGQGAPFFVALLSIPPLVRGLGVERFGVLTLAWMVVGYFSLFDFGLGRALTKLVADRLGSGERSEIAPLVWTALGSMAALGVVGAVVIVILTPWMVHRVIKIPAPLHGETTTAFLLLALTVPLVVVTVALRGVLEANQRFGVVNLVRVPMGIVNFVGPLATLTFSRSLVAVVGVLAGFRFVGALVHFYLCRRLLPDQMAPPAFRASLVRPLIAFGGWITVTNIVGPLMVYLDRFLVGALVSIGAVTFYVAPYEIVTRLSIVPTALVAVLFPAFATTLAAEPARTALLLDRGSRYVFLALFPITLSVVTFARFGLEAWLGRDFAVESTRVLQWLAVGVLLNGMAQIPFAYLQGIGRPHLTAKLHLLELPAYLLLICWAVPAFGIVGAAIAWVARATVDAAALFVMTACVASNRRPVLFAATYATAGVSLMLVAGILDGGLLGLSFLLIVVAGYVPLTWRVMFSPEERALVRLRLKGMPT